MIKNYLLIYQQSIRQGSIIGEIEGICVGDQIEKIDNVSMVGCRHFEVAKALKQIPVGVTFTLRVVEPVKSGFCEYLLLQLTIISISCVGNA